MNTPTEPTSPEGVTTIVLADVAIQYAADAARPLATATVGLPLVRDS